MTKHDKLRYEAKLTLITTNNYLARHPLGNISKYCDLREYSVLCDIM